MRAYDEFRWKGAELCALLPPDALFPRHLMLGLVHPEKVPCPRSTASLLPSPAVSACEADTRKLLQLFTRLVEMANSFTNTPSLPNGRDEGSRSTRRSGSRRARSASGRSPSRPSPTTTSKTERRRCTSCGTARARGAPRQSEPELSLRRIHAGSARLRQLTRCASISSLTTSCVSKGTSARTTSRSWTRCS